MGNKKTASLRCSANWRFFFFFLLKATGDDGASLGQGFDQVDVVKLRNRSRSWNAHYFVGIGEKHEEAVLPFSLALVTEAEPFGVYIVQPLAALRIDSPGFLPFVIAEDNRMAVNAVVAYVSASSRTLPSTPALKVACVHRYLQ